MADTAMPSTLSKSKAKTPDRLPTEGHSAYKAFEIFAVLRNLQGTKELYESETGDVRNSWRITRNWPWTHDWCGRLGIEPLPQPKTPPKYKTKASKSQQLPAPIEGAPARLPNETDVAYFAFTLFWQNVQAGGVDRALTNTEEDFRAIAGAKRHRIHAWKIDHQWWQRVGHPEEVVKAEAMAAAIEKLGKLKAIGDAHNQPKDLDALEELEKINRQHAIGDAHNNKPDLSYTQIPEYLAHFQDLSDYTIEPISDDLIKQVRDVGNTFNQATPPPQTRTIKLDVLAQTLLELAQAQQQQAIEELTAQLIELEEMLEVTDKILSTPSNGAIPPNLLAAISKLPAPAKHYSQGVRAARRALDLLAGIIK